MTQLKVMVLALACALSPALSHAAGDPAAGKAAFAVCAACHGQNAEGIQAMNAPRLAGQEGWYLRRQLDAFKAGHRGTRPGDTFGMQMRPMASAVAAPAAVDNLLAYIATLKPPASAMTVKGDLKAGQAAYAVCAACHGQKAEGLEQMGGPGLAAQDDWYLVRSLQSYKKGLRGYAPQDTFGRQMAPMAATLANDAAVNNVVSYIKSLR